MLVPELLLLIGSLSATGASVWWWRHRALRDHVTRTRTAWVRAGWIVRFSPVSALCLGHSPERDRRIAAGALGISSRALIFDGLRTHHLDRDIALEHLIRIMICPPSRANLPARLLSRSGRPTLSLLYHDDSGRWHVSTFLLEDPLALAETLTHNSNAPILQECGAALRYGPVQAIRLLPTASGDWLPDRTGDLYLAPGLLIFNWTDVHPLDQIAYLDVFSGGRPLLRLELTDGSVLAYELDDPGAWGDAIHAQSDLPIARH